MSFGGPARQPYDVADGVDLLTEYVRQRADEIAHTATASIWERDRALRRAATTRACAPRCESHCRQVFGAFISTLAERRDPSRADFPWTGRHAMRRVDLGIALADFMKAFRIGQIVAVGRRPGRRRAATRDQGRRAA